MHDIPGGLPSDNELWCIYVEWYKRIFYPESSLEDKYIKLFLGQFIHDIYSGKLIGYINPIYESNLVINCFYSSIEFIKRKIEDHNSFIF